MTTTPTKEAIIGQFINGRNATDDFLQLATNHGGTVFGWIDSDGHLQGSLLFGTGSPGGSNTDVQFNDSGTLNGNNGFTYNKSTQAVQIGSSITAASEIITGAGLISTVPVTITQLGTGPTNATNTALFLTDGVTPGAGVYFSTTGNNFRIRMDASTINAHGNLQWTSTGMSADGGSNSPAFFIYTGAPNGGYSGITNQSAQFDMLGTGLLAVTANPGLGDHGEVLIDPFGSQVIFYGDTSGHAAIGTATAAGTPNKINLPTTTGTNGQVLTTDGGNPQQLTWTTVSGGTPTLDAVLNPVASKTFTLGANSLAFTGTAGITLTNTGGSNNVTIENTAASGSVNLQNDTGATGGVVNVANFNTTGAINITDVRGLGIFIQSESATTGQIGISVGAGNDPEIVLTNSGITTTNSKAGGTVIGDSSSFGIFLSSTQAAASSHGITLQDSSAFGVFLHTTNAGSTGGVVLQDDGASGILLEASSGTGPVEIDTNATGGLLISHAGGTATLGVNAGPFTTVSSIKAIDGIVVTLTGTSDKRLKTDIQPFTSGLDVITQIKPKMYSWNEEGQKKTGFAADVRQVGFIAQDIQMVIPEAVTAEGDYLALDTRPIIAALVNAVRELNLKILKLQSKE